MSSCMMTIIVMILFTGVAMVSGFMVPVSNNNFVGTRKDMALSMGGNNAKFGIFSPAVYFAKFALGDAKLNKIRGKAISLHSQAITEWCNQYGAYHMRLKLIKKAKKNGDRLGFLV